MKCKKMTVTKLDDDREGQEGGRLQQWRKREEEDAGKRKERRGKVIKVS